MKNKIKEYLSIPNILCYIRIVLVPVFLYVYFLANSSRDYILAAIIIIVSSLTDFLDGYIARHCDMITDFGKVIDPIADKLTQFSVAIALVFNYPLFWLLVIIIFLKDGMILMVSLYLYGYGLKVKGASWWGKVSTAFFDVSVIILIGYYCPNTILSNSLIIISFILMLFSFIKYAKELSYYYTHRKEIKDEQERN
ncbi:MAG: CDP-alcohol phosphatidyltransferase family protein [Thomasclavelia sp.]|nr:CDP-alcohol phosphatidyltransferase family protein [Thomasclavelia sp.]